MTGQNVFCVCVCVSLRACGGGGEEGAEAVIKLKQQMSPHEDDHAIKHTQPHQM